MSHDQEGTPATSILGRLKFRFSLFSMFLCVTLIAVLAAWYSERNTRFSHWAQGRWEASLSFSDLKNPISAAKIQLRPGGSCRCSNYYGSTFREGEWTYDRFTKKLTIAVEDPATPDPDDRHTWACEVLYYDDKTLLIEYVEPKSNNYVGLRMMFNKSAGTW